MSRAALWESVLECLGDLVPKPKTKLRANVTGLYSCVSGCSPHAMRRLRGPNRETTDLLPAKAFERDRATPSRPLSKRRIFLHGFIVLDCLNAGALLLLMQVSSAALVSNDAGDGCNVQSVLTGSTVTRPAS